jgi:serine/threonine protein kinase
MTRDDDRLADLLQRWEAAAQAGDRPTPEDLCHDTPEDLPAFRELLAQLGHVGLLSAAGRRDGPPPAAGFRAGRYLAESFHAAGCLGVVYRARDEELNRTVALKCLKAAAQPDSATARRFLFEAEVAGRLEHPGVAPVHGRGRTADGRPFYAMRFVEGETLQDAVRRLHAPATPATGHKLELRRLLRAFVSVCQTVAFAHSKGVIHRDLKPANVVVGQYGEVLVMDWGFAAETRRETRNTIDEVDGREGDSPAFRSPELARGDWAHVGPAGDIYSLGSTLYYLLAGRVPYDGRSRADVVARVRAGRFDPPRAVNPAVPRALDAVCRKAMALDVADRYPTALALAEEVECWLADEPVSAWREPWTVRARRWVRRRLG